MSKKYLKNAVPKDLLRVLISCHSKKKKKKKNEWINKRMDEWMLTSDQSLSLIHCILYSESLDSNIFYTVLM